jgi:hypothetical protein
MLRPYQILSLTLTLLVILSGCATERRVTTHLASKRNEGDIKEHYAGGFSYKKGEDGTMQVVSEKRSSFEGSHFDTGDGKNDFSKKQYETKSFAKSVSNLREKQYSTESWKDSSKKSDLSGKKPEFISRAANVERKGWSDSSKSFATARANEEKVGDWDGRKTYETSNFEQVTEKRKSAIQPPVYTLKEYQIKTVEETRAMMGRSD